MEPSPPVTIRVARAADLQAIGDLWEQLMNFHIRLDRRYETARGAREAFLRYVNGTVFRSPDNVMYVAEVRGRLAGFMIARVEYGGPIFLEPNFGYITDACVDESFRRLGIGHKLFEACKSWLRSRGMSNIRVSVSSDNPVSKSFWSGLGFRPFMERLWYDLS